eukprot:NODE_517_length_2154_cov_42.383373_g475_i0.p1 GENE.NODE_517_length_2154_cov_42.383373_g475_i0~~NODE_517_length_2154_cov_42.383373_g475_i0.p1  ORF type:complete len:641 (+),score=106.47 NODE_517_length_2154_cov_42.383373_g475_i0:76-1998(+)
MGVTCSLCSHSYDDDSSEVDSESLPPQIFLRQNPIQQFASPFVPGLHRVPHPVAAPSAVSSGPPLFQASPPRRDYVSTAPCLPAVALPQGAQVRTSSLPLSLPSWLQTRGFHAELAAGGSFHNGKVLNQTPAPRSPTLAVPDLVFRDEIAKDVCPPSAEVTPRGAYDGHWSAMPITPGPHSTSPNAAHNGVVSGVRSGSLTDGGLDRLELSALARNYVHQMVNGHVLSGSPPPPVRIVRRDDQYPTWSPVLRDPVRSRLHSPGQPLSRAFNCELRSRSQDSSIQDQGDRPHSSKEEDLGQNHKFTKKADSTCAEAAPSCAEDGIADNPGISNLPFSDPLCSDVVPPSHHNTADPSLLRDDRAVEGGAKLKIYDLASRSLPRPVSPAGNWLEFSELSPEGPALLEKHGSLLRPGDFVNLVKHEQLAIPTESVSRGNPCEMERFLPIMTSGSHQSASRETVPLERETPRTSFGEKTALVPPAALAVGQDASYDCAPLQQQQQQQREKEEEEEEGSGFTTMQTAEDPDGHDTGTAVSNIVGRSSSAEPLAIGRGSMVRRNFKIRKDSDTLGLWLSTLSDLQDPIEIEAQVEEDQMTCIVCMEIPRVVVLLPCHHLTSCIQCALLLELCPLCRTEVAHRVEVFV